MDFKKALKIVKDLWVKVIEQSNKAYKYWKKSSVQKKILLVLGCVTLICALIFLAIFIIKVILPAVIIGAFIYFVFIDDWLKKQRYLEQENQDNVKMHFMKTYEEIAAQFFPVLEEYKDDFHIKATEPDSLYAKNKGGYIDDIKQFMYIFEAERNKSENFIPADKVKLMLNRRFEQKNAMLTLAHVNDNKEDYIFFFVVEKNSVTDKWLETQDFINFISKGKEHSKDNHDDAEF